MHSKVLRVFVVLIIFFIASCKSKKNEEMEPVYKISAIVGGFKWYQNTISASLLKDTTPNACVLNINSSSGGKTLIVEVVNMGSTSGVNSGDYRFPSTAFFKYNYSSGPVYTTTSGWIYISDFNASAQTFSGTFNFNVQDTSGTTVQITNGKIVNAPYAVVYR
jgi:hypothetical protein